jgi:murein DD-endopeptidase MepM/ murein hydrolase activator NlpD
VKPFDKQHPVRGFLNDPRIQGQSAPFHFGIDVSAPDGTAVYAVEPGRFTSSLP